MGQKINIIFIISFLLVACSGSDAAVGPKPYCKPKIIVKDAIVHRQNSNATARFYVDLSSTSDKKISVQYSTKSGTAKQGDDFETASGTITFQPGNKEKSIDICVVADSLRQPSQDFSVELSNPQNAKLSKANATGTIINDGTYLSTDETGYQTPNHYPGYILYWNDEFDAPSLNDEDWNYETGGNGWGNNELENYSSRTANVFLSSGNLIISARKENYGGNKYTSGRITTQKKMNFTYGRVDIRAKLPVAHGLWPALWMLGSKIASVTWPICGETDIMELVGQNPSQIIGSFHWQKADKTEGTVNDMYDLENDDFSDSFHVFSLVWTHDSLKILVDDQPYVEASRDDLSNGIYAFDDPFFLIFNVAVGGDWPGPPDASTHFPQRMFVDYVRVFQQK